MARRKDPILAVLHYFETVELPLAEQALALVKAIVADRRGPMKPATKTKAKKRSSSREVDVPLPLTN